MNEIHKVIYGHKTIEYSLERRNRKTLEISVYPNMTVRVIAPYLAALSDVQLKVKKRAGWILKQIQFFEQFHPKLPERCYLSGETHLYLGREYRLKVVRSLHKEVKLARGMLYVYSHTPERADITRYILEKWYLERAKVKFAERLEACLRVFPNKVLFNPQSLIIRHLTNRWGSMTNAGNLVLNRQLIKASVQSIDYVITHELCHLKYKNHDQAFYNLLESVLPSWEKEKVQLERALAQVFD